MQIERLDHVNLRTTQLDKMQAWYENVLGLSAGYRPDFPFPGAWLYAGEHPVVHLVGIEGDTGTGSELPLKLEHFAFQAKGQADFEQRLTQSDTTFRKSGIAEIGIIAYNVWDPDGNHIHVDFQEGAG